MTATGAATATIDTAIKLPLPMSVTGSLMNLIGAAWPDAQLADNSDGLLTGGQHLVFRVPAAPAKAISAEEVEEALMEPLETDEQVTEFGPAGISITRSQELTLLMLEAAKEAFAQNPDAPNYHENKVRDPDTGKHYVLIFARSHGQTPHELRMAAETKLEAAGADIHREATEAVMGLLGAADTSGTYADGVRAALEALRQLNFSRINA